VETIKWIADGDPEENKTPVDTEMRAKMIRLTHQCVGETNSNILQNLTRRKPHAVFCVPPYPIY
jgi:hypothetical protein